MTIDDQRKTQPGSQSKVVGNRSDHLHPTWKAERDDSREHDGSGSKSLEVEETVLSGSPESEQESSGHVDSSSSGSASGQVGPPAEFGDYELFEEVGRGGMGVVFRARHKRLNRIVALKVILWGKFASRDDVQRFYSEAEAAAILQHPGIVPIYEVGQCDGRHFFSMGFVEGTTLAAAVGTGPLEGDRAATLVAKVADAIAYAHRRGVINRDLKPGNILIDERGEPHVSDFGLAKRTDSDSQLTGTGQIIGTPNYMPPEQASAMNDLIGPHSDVYSLGAILYCLLTGRPPFQAASLMQTVQQVIQQDPVPPRQLNASVKKDLETICLKCLQKEPSARYPSADSLKADLNRFLKLQPIEARPISKTARGWRWCRRNPVVSSLGCLLAVLAVALAVGGPLIAITEARLRTEADRLLREKSALTDILGDSIQQTDAARQRAETTAAALHENLVRMYVDRGNSEINDGDPVAALPWYAEALAMDAGDSDHQWGHRFRIASILQQAPRPRKIWRLASETYKADVSPDGKLVAAAGRDGNVLVWDAESGDRVFGPENLRPTVVNALEFSRDNRRLLHASGRMVQVWDLTTGRASFPAVDCGKPVRHASLDESGRMIAVGLLDGQVRLLDARTGKQIRGMATHDGRIYRVAVSSQADRLISTGADHIARLFELSSGELIATLEHDGPVVWTELDPSATRVVTASEDGRVKIWDSASGEMVGEPLVHPARVRVARFDRSGRLLATGAWDSAARIWDVESGRMVTGPMMHTNSIPQLDFSSDGSYLITASLDHTARIWDTVTGDEVCPALHHGFLVQTARFLPKGNFVMTASADSMIRIWDFQPQANLLAKVQHGGSVKSCRFDPTGNRVLTASTDGTARIWSVDSGKPTTDVMEHLSAVAMADFSGDGELVVTASVDGTARVWSAHNGRPVTRPLRHGGPVHHAEFSRDNTRVVTACQDRLARIWDVESQQLIHRLRHGNRVNWARFSPDQRWVLTCSDDRTAMVWNTRTGEAMGASLDHVGKLERGDFSPDCSLVVTTSNDHTAQIWEIATGRKAAPPLTHSGGVYTACFTPSGRQVVTGARDGSARLWNVHDGSPAGPIMSIDAGLVRAVVSPCGRFIATAGGRGARLWDARTGRLLAGQMDHDDWVNQVRFSHDSTKLVSVGEDATARIWRIPQPDDRSVEQLKTLAHLISGHQADSIDGLRPLEPVKLQELLR